MPLNEEKHKSENDLVESEKKQAAKQTEFADSDPGYIRWTGTSLFRSHAKPGDLVIGMWRPHSKSKRGTVYAPEPLLHRKDKRKVTHFFVEEYADREDTAISFTNFVALWRRLGSGRPPSLKPTRGLPVELAESPRAAWK